MGAASKVISHKSAVAVCLVSLTLAGPQVPPDQGDDACPPCAHKTDPAAKTGSQKDDNADFTWYSDADQEQPGGGVNYCYGRYVRNHAATVLSFHWPLGRLDNDRLSPGGLSKRCLTYLKPKNPVSNGPLRYGNHNNQVATQVWEGEDEPVPADAIRASLTFDLWRAGHSDRVAVSLVSRVEESKPTGAAPVSRPDLRCVYEIRNLSSGVAGYRIAWKSALSPAFTGELKRRDYGDGPIRLERLDTLQVEVRSPGRPRLVADVLAIYDGEEIVASAGVPAWVPDVR